MSVPLPSLEEFAARLASALLQGRLEDPAVMSNEFFLDSREALLRALDGSLTRRNRSDDELEDEIDNDLDDLDD